MNSPANSDGSWHGGQKIWEVGFLSGYNLCIFFGIILAFLTAAYFWKRNNYSWENLQVIMIISIPCAIFGARFYAIALGDGGHWSEFFHFQGLSIYGGVIGAVIPVAIYLWFRRSSLDYRTVISAMLPTILLGQAIGRWGNFQNHELYGNIIDGSKLDWMGGLKSHMFIDSNYRVPIFFIESMLTLTGYIVIVWIFNDRGLFKPGVTGMMYVFWYGMVRVILQNYTDPSPANTDYIGGVSTNIVTSSILMSISLPMMAWYQFGKKFQVTLVDKEITIFGKKIKLTLFKTSLNPIKSNRKQFTIGKEYELIKPSKEVRRFWVGPKYERTFRIYVVKHDDKKWSKRELNSGKK